ncbi:MAG: M16 family metallopeptidase [Mycobacteriales bacterium]
MPSRSASRPASRPTSGPRPRAALATSYRIERTVLSNGLTVVLAPDRSAAVVGVAVYYDVGFRSEPEGRTGFAHLFEHMMFQGSASIGKMAHAHLVQGAGGTMNGSTHPDFTNYYEALPSNGLELALFLEADRMRSVALTEENLANQVAVVQNEIRVNVQNRPYGGFPWILLPSVAFDTFPNAHNGYGDFSELEAATLSDAQDFFDTYYAPGNAVLAIAGDLDPARTLALVESHFGDIPARKVPRRPDFSEPPLTAERWVTHDDPLAPTPALAAGWRAPDPAREADAYLATVVLAEALAEGDASRLRQRLVLSDRTAISVEAYLGPFGDPFEQRAPLLFTVTALHSEQVGARTVLDAIDAELARVATDGLAPGELSRVVARLSAQLLRRVDQVLGRTLALAMFEQVRGGADGVNTLPTRLAQVSAEDVRAAAARLTPDARAVLELRPGSVASEGSAA